MIILGIGFPVLFLPQLDVFLLSLFPTGEVFRVLRLFQRVPIIQHPVGGNYFSVEGYAPRRLRDCKKIR